VTGRAPRRAKARRALEGERNGVKRVDGRPADRASHPRQSVRRSVRLARVWLRRAYTPSADSISHLQPLRRGTKTQESRPPWQQEGPPPTCPSRRGGSFAPGWRESAVRGSTWQRATGPCSARGVAATPVRKDRENGQRFNSASSRSSGRRPPGDPVVKGREARGAAGRGHGQNAPSSTPERARTGLVTGARALAKRSVGWVAARR